MPEVQLRLEVWRPAHPDRRLLYEEPDDEDQRLSHYRGLAESSGFDVLAADEAGRVLILHLQKPG